MINTLAIRNNILRLAFSGKLSCQKDTDGSVSELLQRVNPKKEIVQIENIPYEIPESWSWVKFSDLYSINPKVDAAENDDAAFIPMERISPGFSDSFTYETQSWGKASKNHTKFRNGDVAFAKISPCFENRKSFIAKDLPNGIGGGTTELIIIRQPEMCPEYTYYVLIDQRFINTGAASYKGTVGQQRVQSDVIKNYLVPVPPLSEQERIAKKVSEAFSILDAIDELQSQYSANQEALKSKLIDAAIQGRLTEQLPEDGFAEELYQQIQGEKKKLEKEGKIKKEKKAPAINEDELPFEIPLTWKWVRLSEIGLLQTGTTPSKSNPNYFGDYIPFVSPGEIQDNVITRYDKQGLSESGAAVARVVEKDSVLQVCIGGSIGKAAINDRAITFNQQINSVTPYIMNHEYIFYCLTSNYFISRITMASAGAATPIINKTNWGNLVIPLAPLAEQDRIVEKLNGLFVNLSE